MANDRAVLFLDTNIFLRPAVKDNQAMAAECEALIEEIMTGTFEAMTSEVVVAELVWTCRSFYHMDKQEIVELVQGIHDMKHLTVCTDTDLQEALTYFSHHAIKFVDALIAGHRAIRTRRARLVSYDKDFDTLGVTRLEPSAFI